jgi:hypothetical protein
VEEARKKRVLKTQRPKLPHNRKRHGVYDMTAVPRGRCVIFVNSSFKEHKFETGKKKANGEPEVKSFRLSPLGGYDQDAEILQRVFEELHFHVCVFKNKSAKRMLYELSKVAGEPLRGTAGDSRPNAFVAIILSHGNERGVLGVNYISQSLTPDEVISEQQIIEALDNAHCPLLRDRPKLVFVQACQGSKKSIETSV